MVKGKGGKKQEGAPREQGGWIRNLQPWQWGLLVAVISLVVGIIRAIIPPLITLRPSPTPTIAVTPTCSVPVAGSDEILVLVAHFHGTGGVDPVPRIVHHLEEHLAKTDLPNVRIKHVPDEPMDSDEARELGEMCEATLVIWGTYDDYGITPHHEVTRQEELVREKVYLEEVMNRPSEPDSFALYVTGGLPQAMTYVTLFTIGQIQYFGGEDEEALDTFYHALQTVITYTTHKLKQEHIYFWMGYIYSLQEAWQESIEAYSRAIEFDPSSNLNFAMAYYGRGLAQYYQGNLDQAMDDLTKAIGIEPEFADAYNTRGVVHWQRDKRNERNEAIADFNKAIEIDPNFAKAYVNRGITYRELEDYKQAIADFAKAIEIDPNYARAYHNRGLTYHKRGDRGDYEQAIADFAKAIEIDPNYARAYLRRGITYRELEDYDRAIADFTMATEIFAKATEIDPNFAKAYYERGLTYVDLGEYDKAIADFAKAIDIKPDYANAYYNRGLTYRTLGDYEQAIADFESYLLIAPPDKEERRTRVQQYIDEMQEQR